MGEYMKVYAAPKHSITSDGKMYYDEEQTREMLKEERLLAHFMRKNYYKIMHDHPAIGASDKWLYRSTVEGPFAMMQKTKPCGVDCYEDYDKQAFTRMFVEVPLFEQWTYSSFDIDFERAVLLYRMDQERFEMHSRSIEDILVNNMANVKQEDRMTIYTYTLPHLALSIRFIERGKAKHFVSGHELFKNDLKVPFFLNVPQLEESFHDADRGVVLRGIRREVLAYDYTANAADLMRIESVDKIVM
jgi:hypothetical protein